MRFVHPELHPLFETLGYASGFALYRWQRRQGDVISQEQRWSILAAATFGALIGSRILGLLEQAPRIQLHWSLLLAPGGKTIVGGLLGGWLAVEITKRLLKIRTRTGDLFVVPLAIGIAIGRIGCFFAGLADDTYGRPTSLPWGVDFGDGIPRHPTQLYEIIFLLLLAFTLQRMMKRKHREGSVFRVFIGAYLAWRLLIDFLKPQPIVYAMNAIQWACAAGLLVLFFSSLANWPRRVASMRPS
jgi:phosphatidylglycerol---prolipoprotein diacylglyceryl transferase